MYKNNLSIRRLLSFIFSLTSVVKQTGTASCDTFIHCNKHCKHLLDVMLLKLFRFTLFRRRCFCPAHFVHIKAGHLKLDHIQ